MNTFAKNTLITLGVISTAATFSTTFASSTTSNAMPQRGGQMQKDILSSYLRSDLTDSEKTAMKAIEKTYREAVIALLKDTTDTTTVSSQLEALKTTYINDMLTYIATDKVDEFKALVEKMATQKAPQARSGSGEMRDGSGSERGENMYLSGYIRSDLTDDETTAMKAVQTTYRDALKALRDEASSSEDESETDDDTTTTDFETQLATIRTTYITNILPYIQSDKQDEFKTMVENSSNENGNRYGSNKNGKNQANRSDKSTSTKKSTGTQKSASTSSILNANVSATIDKKLASYSTTEEKEAWINAVIAKIDTVSANVSSTKTKTLLTALKDLLNEKLDDLSGNTLDTNGIEDLLSE